MNNEYDKYLLPKDFDFKNHSGRYQDFIKIGSIWTTRSDIGYYYVFRIDKLDYPSGKILAYDSVPSSNWSGNYEKYFSFFWNAIPLEIWKQIFEPELKLKIRKTRLKFHA